MTVNSNAYIQVHPGVYFLLFFHYVANVGALDEENNCRGWTYITSTCSHVVSKVFSTRREILQNSFHALPRISLSITLIRRDMPVLTSTYKHNIATE
jgi:hypothetical protein